ncbi:MAG: hybrid sensor histidine kinase/response regulator [Labilithrix sp.]|nr:hybrid sensor histidine kinase/response regulator [Labilithrix sp.]MCW5831858.1 hybrid sensor histidine kinase/response regulator [Labilithrix sp.]
MSSDAAAKILVVDDNEANRSLAKATLEDEGYTVVLASGGAEGIAAFTAERPSCVLLDVRMPDVDGFAVCERLRALPRGDETPILFLTALRDVDTFDRALRAGGDDFLTKPVRPTELVVRVQTALELRRIKAELRDHYALLKKQRDDLLRLQLQKERLTAFVVHDLKNPVNTMDLHAQLLIRDKELSPSARESAAQIRTDARHLTRMIMNLLDMSKADEGQLAPKRAEVDLPELVRSVIAELEVSARSRDVKLRSAIAVPRVVADADLLRRIVTNLAENATRYAPPASAVTISADRTDGATELRIADTGPGIPAGMREKVFDPFVQVEAGERQVGRTSRGLGLSFCRTAVEAHGGTIWVEDASPGTTFCLRLPDEP